VTTKRASSLVPIVVVTGEDDAMIASEVRLVLDELLGERDPGLVVEEVAGLGGEELDVGAVIDAYTTPPFLVDRRIVVVRDAGRLDKEGVARLIAAIDPPSPGAALVLVKGSKAIPAAIVKKASALGRVVDVSIRKSAAKREFVAEHLRHAAVRLSSGAQKLLEAHLGEDLGRLDGILATLAAAYGEGVSVDEAMLAPFLGTKGSVPIFDLTDALESGNIAVALGIVGRMMGPGGISGHEILASIDNHVTRAARLQGAAVGTGDDAAALLKIHAFPAKKALNLARRLDVEALSDCLRLIMEADLSLKGRSGLDEQLVIEILVARLTRALGAMRG
jgi:DNA polymerase-3 subunit delta